MKIFKQMCMLATVAVAMVFAGCNENSAAKVSVEVRKGGAVVANEQVYMFRGNMQDVFFKSKIHATKNIATDENGIAEFDVPEIYFATDNQATAIFETFDANENVNGKVAVSVRKGDSKKATLYMN